MYNVGWKGRERVRRLVCFVSFYRERYGEHAMGRGGPATKTPPSLSRSIVFRFLRSLAVNRIPIGPERLLGVSLWKFE